MIIFCSVSFVCFVSVVQGREMTKVTPEQLKSIKENCGIRKPTGTAGRCGAHNTFKILHGHKAKAGKYPWAVRVTTHKLVTRKLAINNKKVSSEYEYSSCSGSMISPIHIITAAHCLFNTVIYLNSSGFPITSKEVRASNDFPYTVEPDSVRVHYGMLAPVSPIARAIYTLADPLGKDTIAGEDYAFVETDGPPAMHLSHGDILPICMTNEPKQYSNKFHDKRTFAAFGDEPRLRWLGDIKDKAACEEPRLSSPLLKCYTYEGQTDSQIISQPGDSGGGFIRWRKKTHRAYLDAVLGGHSNIIKEMYGINVPETEAEPRSPLRVAQTELGLDYQTFE